MSGQLLVGLSSIYSGLGNTAHLDDQKMMHIEQAAIWIENGRIKAVGPEDEVRAQAPKSVSVVDMGGKVAVPGFIDPHTHLIWGGDRSGEFNKRLHGAGYVEIAQAGGGIKSTVAQTRAASIETLTEKGRRTLDDMLRHGVTTIETKSGYGLDLETEMKQLDVMDRLSESHPIDMVQTFLGAHEVPPEYKGDPSGYIDYLNHSVLPAVKERGTVSYVDIFCEKGVFELEDSRRHLQAALDAGFQLRVHADELFPLGGAGLAAELGAVSADHLCHASEEDIAAMAAAGTTAVLLPGTAFFLRGPYARFEVFKKHGCKIALSTDFNPGSSHTVSQALMMALGCMKMGMTFEEAFLAVTLNAADSLGLADDIGTLEVGKKADICFLDVPSAMYLVYYWGINHVSDVLKNGSFVVRDRRRVSR